MIRKLTNVTSNFRMIKPRCISSQNSRHCEIDVSNCWNELYRDTSWLPCSKYQILNQTNVWAIHFDKSGWFVKNWNGVNLFNLFVFLLRLWKIVCKNKILLLQNYKIFSIDVFGFDGSVTEWPGRVGVVICWSRVQTPTMLLSGFFFVCLVFNFVAALCLSPTSIIFPSLTTYYPY